MCTKPIFFHLFGRLHCTKDLTIEHKIRQNIADGVESCGFNLRINIRSCGDGRMPHTGAKGLHFHTGSGIHGRVGMSKLSGIKMGEVDGFLHPLPEGFVSGLGEQSALVVGNDITFRHPVFQQDVGKHIAHGNEAVAEAGLRGLYNGCGKGKNDRPLYMDE